MNLINKLNLTYSKCNDNKLCYMDSKYSLVDIAQETDMYLDEVKYRYSKGVALLTALVKAYKLIVANEKTDYVDDEIEQLWLLEQDDLAYIPYIGIDEFAVLYKKDKNLLKTLINNKGDKINDKRKK